MYPQVDDIMVALYAGPNKESFDWALSVKMKWGGYAAFRVDDGTEGFCWSDRSGRENIKVVTSSRLAAFVKIGSMAVSRTGMDSMANIFYDVPTMTWNQEGASVRIDSKTWVKEAIESLNKHRVITVFDVEATMKECEDLGISTYSDVDTKNSAGNWTYFVSKTASC